MIIFVPFITQSMYYKNIASREVAPSFTGLSDEPSLCEASLFNAMEEIWKEVPFNSMYLVSNLGNVVSLKFGKRTLIKLSTTSHGYLRFSCRNKGKMKRDVYIHRILAQLFIPNPDNKPEVNHINGIKSDNSLNNLEWCTTKENSLHAWSNGLNRHSTKQFGEGHGMSIINEIQAKMILAWKGKISQYAVASHFGISQSLVSCIQRKRLWKHL